MSIGYVSAVGEFAAKIPAAERPHLLAPYLTPDESGELALRDEECDQFVSLCDLSLQQLLRQRRVPVTTLRADVGYGWPKYRKDWFQLGCQLLVDREEQDAAIDFLLVPENAGILDARFEQATRELLQGINPTLFTKIHATFEVYQEPIWDS